MYLYSIHFGFKGAPIFVFSAIWLGELFEDSFRWVVTVTGAL